MTILGGNDYGTVVSSSDPHLDHQIDRLVVDRHEVEIWIGHHQDKMVADDDHADHAGLLRAALVVDCAVLLSEKLALEKSGAMLFFFS